VARGRSPDRVACEALEKGLRRKDAARAVAGLLRLDAAARGPWLAAVAALFRSEVERLRGAERWADLCRCAAHARTEPRLVSEGPSAADADEARWALLWGAARGGRFEDAERWRAELAAGAPATAQPLLAAVGSWLAARGRPAPGGLPRIALPGIDPRLGREPAAPRRNVAAPTRESDAEEAVLELLVSAPWKDFAATVSAWADALPPPLARRVGVVAGGLAVREVLRRLVAGEPRAVEPAALLADLVRALGAPAELEDETVLAMRAVGANPAGAVGHDVTQIRDLARLAGAAALYAEHRAWVTEAVLRVPVAPEASGPLMALLEGWLRTRPEAPLFFRVLQLWQASRRPSSEAPAWLVEAARRLGDGDGVAACLSSMRPTDRAEALVTLVTHLPPDVSERVLASAWQVGEPEVRRDVARAVRRLVERLRALGTCPRRGWKSVLQREAFLDLVAAAEAGLTLDHVLPLLLEAGLPPREIDQVLSLVAQVIGSIDHSPAARDLWRRWQDRLVPLHPTYLCLALRHAGSPEEAGTVTRSYLATRPGPEGCLDVAVAVHELGPHPVASAVLTEALTSDGMDPLALATVLRRASERGLALPVQKAIARVVLLVAGAPARRGARPPEVDAAVALARELLGPVRPRKPGRRGGRKQRAAGELPPGEQLPIFGKEST
jgi:hypothetical protein